MLLGKGIESFRQEKEKNIEQKDSGESNFENMREFFATIYDEWEKLSNDEQQQYTNKTPDPSSKNSNSSLPKKIAFPSFDFIISKDKNKSNNFDMNSSLEFGSFTPSTSPEWPQSFSFGRQPSENHDNNFSRSKLKKKFLRHETHHKKAKKDPPQDDNKQGLEKIIENVVPDLDAEDVSKLVKELENTTSNIVKTMPPPFYYIPGYYYVPCIACVPTTNTNANPPYNQMCNPYGQMFSPYGQMPYPQMIFPPQQNIFPR